MTESHITFGGQTFSLNPSYQATVDTAGNLATSSRTTATRVVAGGLLFGPVGAIVGASAKKNRVHDTRELYLLVQGDAFSGIITCRPDDGPKVRQLAVAISNAGRNVEQMLAYRAHTMATTAQALATEQENTAELVSAQNALDSARSATQRKDQAAAEVSQASAAAVNAYEALEPPAAS